MENLRNCMQSKFARTLVMGLLNVMPRRGVWQRRRFPNNTAPEACVTCKHHLTVMFVQNRKDSLFALLSGKVSGAEDERTISTIAQPPVVQLLRSADRCLYWLWKHCLLLSILPGGRANTYGHKKTLSVENLSRAIHLVPCPAIPFQLVPVQLRYTIVHVYEPASGNRHAAYSQQQ